jgi:hypothetical protein
VCHFGTGRVRRLKLVKGCKCRIEEEEEMSKISKGVFNCIVRNSLFRVHERVIPAAVMRKRRLYIVALGATEHAFVFAETLALRRKDRQDLQ